MMTEDGKRYPVIETERLSLKPISLEYREEIFKTFTKEITLYMYPAPAEDISETDAFIHSSRENMEKGVELICAVTLKKSGEFLGCTGIHKIDTAKPELGIWIKKSAHGNGYGKEAIYGLVRWAKKDLQFDYLIYPVDRENIPSRKIPESLRCVILREYTVVNMKGETLNLLEYGIKNADLQDL